MPMTLRQAPTLSDTVPAKKGVCFFVFGINPTSSKGEGKPRLAMSLTVKWPWLMLLVDRGMRGIRKIELCQCNRYCINTQILCCQLCCLCKIFLLSWLFLIMIGTLLLSSDHLQLLQITFYFPEFGKANLCKRNVAAGLIFQGVFCQSVLSHLDCGAEIKNKFVVRVKCWQVLCYVYVLTRSMPMLTLLRNYENNKTLY